jgi:HEAT repeat protein
MAASRLSVLGPQVSRLEARLIHALETDPSEEVRASCAKALGRFVVDPTRAVPALRRALLEAGPGETRGIARALETFGVEVEDLEEKRTVWTGDCPGARVRIVLEDASGNTAPQTHEGTGGRNVEHQPNPDSLRAAIHSDYSDIARPALRRIQDLGPRALPWASDVVAALSGPCRGFAVDALVKMGEGCLETVLRAMEGKEAPGTQGLLQVLERMGPAAQRAAPRILEAVESSDEKVRRAAVRALCSVDPARARLRIPEVARGDPDPGVRSQAVSLLPTIIEKTDELLPLLRTSLEDSHPWVREAGARIVGELGPAARSLVPVLAGGANDGESSGIMFCMALGSMGEVARSVAPAVATVLDRVIEEEETMLIERTRAAANDTGPFAGLISPVPMCWHPETMAVGEALVRIDPGAALPGIRRLLGSRQSPMRSMGLDLFRKSGLSNKQIRETLLRDLENEEPGGPHVGLLRALASYRPMDREIVRAMLEGCLPMEDRRCNGFPERLARVEEETGAVVPELIRGLNDSRAGMRRLCARVLGRIGPEAKGALTALEKAALKAETEDDRKLFLGALNAVDPPFNFLRAHRGPDEGTVWGTIRARPKN